MKEEEGGEDAWGSADGVRNAAGDVATWDGADADADAGVDIRMQTEELATSKDRAAAIVWTDN